MDKIYRTNNKLNKNKKRWISKQVRRINLTVKWEFVKFAELCKVLQTMIADYKCILKVNYIKAISPFETSLNYLRTKEMKIEEEVLTENMVADLVLDQSIGQEETKKPN